MKLLLNSQGFSLIEIVVAATLSSFVFLGLSNYLADSVFIQKSQEIQINLQNIRNEFLLHISNPTSFARMQNHSSFDCIRAGNCTAPEPIVVFRNDTTIFYDAQNAGSGFSFAGLSCDTYPSPLCSIRINIVHHDQCYNCNPPQIRIRGQFEIAPDSGFANNINLERYNFSLIRSLN